MVTTKSLRYFADDCCAWASKVDNPSQRQTILSAGRSWAATADAIEKKVKERPDQVLPDLRRKLN